MRRAFIGLATRSSEMSNTENTGDDMIADDERVILCIPRGGMNDVFCQIQECWRYAEEYGRTLIIDSTRSGLLGHFSDFFSVKPTTFRVIERINPKLFQKLNGLRCNPPEFEGRLGDYVANYVEEVRNYCEIAIGVRVAFDKEKDHDEQLLLYEQSGGGSQSAKLFPHLTVSPKIMALVCSRLALLKPDYIAVHVRNTDYRTNYGRFFFDIYPKTLDKNLLICSDDYEVIEKAKSVFRHANVFTVTDIPNMGKIPLHHPDVYDNDEDRHMATVRSLIDLIAMGGADALYFNNVSLGFPSGFSNLANTLFENKQLITSLLDGRTLESLRSSGHRQIGALGHPPHSRQDIES